MKQTFLALLSLFLGGFAVAQQSSLYLLYSSSCMDQLEYRYVYTGATVVAYSLRPSASEHYVLTTGSGGINSPTLPKNTVKCGEFTLNEQFLNDVNNLKRQVYIVHQQANGYLLVPVISASQVIRSGTYYLYRASSYSFAIDTSNLVYESNIATGSSSWYIYFNGLKIRGCYYEYSFKREPTKVGQERSEFDFIPGVGVTVERTGMTAAEAENNQYRLVKINGLALEDYITNQCQGRAGAPTTAPVSKYTPEVNYGPGAIREGDKEIASLPNITSGPVGDPNLPPPLVNCPEPPGEGYHIVQPGETLNGISRAYNVSLKSLVGWNKIKDPDLIQVCQKVWVRKPPTTPTMMAYKGEQPQANATPAQPEVRRQDVYWRTNANPAQPATYSLTQQPTSPYVPTAKPLVHTVQRGETLYGIGQRYGITESEMRRLNQYPAYGEVLLQPGMQVFVSDCCPDQTTSPTPATTTTPYPNLGTQPQPAATTPVSSGGVLPELYSTPTTTQPTPATYGQPTAPVTYGQPNTTITQPVATQPAATKQPTYFQEYIVREGDTINSIAVKFKVSAQELALVNNKDANESLIAGQRLLIPRN